MDYKVTSSAAGDLVYKEIQKKGNNEYLDGQIGAHPLCANSFVRIQGAGPKSISFNTMRFEYLGAIRPENQVVPGCKSDSVEGAHVPMKVTYARERGHPSSGAPFGWKDAREAVDCS